MDNQSTVQDAINEGATASSQILRGKGLNTDNSIDNTAEVTPIIAQIPMVGLAYRFFDGWRSEFSPRLYGEDSVVLLQSDENAEPTKPVP